MSQGRTVKDKRSTQRGGYQHTDTVCQPGPVQVSGGLKKQIAKVALSDFSLQQPPWLAFLSAKVRVTGGRDRTWGILTSYVYLLHDRKQVIQALVLST